MDSLAKRNSAKWWRVSGIVLVLLGTILAVPLQQQKDKPDDVDWSSLAIFGPLAAACTWGGFACFMRGRRLKALSAQELTRLDRRPPVLYLRSFKDDAAGASNYFVGLMGIPSFVFGMLTEEEQMAEAFRGIGPLIAIGKPGEKLPLTGAARMYVGDAEWHERVEELMRESRLVAMRIGKTPGFWWELERARDLVGPSRIVLMVPVLKRAYKKFCRRAEGVLPCALPALPKGSLFTPRQIRALIYFDADWTPHIVPLKGRWSISVNALAPVLRKTLDPIARGLGIDPEEHVPSRPSRFARFAATIPGVLVLLTVWSACGWMAMSKVAARLGPAAYERVNPASAVAHNNLGAALEKKKDYEGAIHEYHKALDIEPNLAAAHENLCAVLTLKDAMTDAIAECREGIRLEPSSAVAHSLLGIALARSGDAAALQEFEAALRLNPGDEEIRKLRDWAAQQWSRT